MQDSSAESLLLALHVEIKDLIGSLGTASFAFSFALIGDGRPRALFGWDLEVGHHSDEIIGESAGLVIISLVHVRRREVLHERVQSLGHHLRADHSHLNIERNRLQAKNKMRLGEKNQAKKNALQHQAYSSTSIADWARSTIA